MVSCALETCKRYDPRNVGQPYVCLLQYHPSTNKYIRTAWVTAVPPVWDRYHRTLWTAFVFDAPVGTPIEARLTSRGSGDPRVYYRVTAHGSHLHKISKITAHRLAIQQARHWFSPSGMHPRQIPAFVRYAIWYHYGGRCMQCGSTDQLEFDHIIPWSKGGTSSPANIQLLCRRCNRHKYNSIL